MHEREGYCYCAWRLAREHVRDRGRPPRFPQRHSGGKFWAISKAHDPPSDPLPKNCECRYHIIVTNVNKKADAMNQNY